MELQTQAASTLAKAIAQQLTLKINNIDGRFDEHDFNGAVITAQVGLELLNGSVEWLDKGKFTAEPGEESGNSISVKAFDDMTKFDPAVFPQQTCISGYPWNHSKGCL